MDFSVVFHPFTEQNIAVIVKQHIVPKVSIEIGLFEGYTAFNMTAWMQSLNSDYKHYAIDPFGVSYDLPNSVVDEAGQKFIKNLQEFPHPNNIEFINKNSWHGLIDLLNRGVKADFIYIDGDHRASTVLEDLVLSFELLNVGGIILCDDCTVWKHVDTSNNKASLQDSPKLAVDNFIQCNWDRLEMIDLPSNYQLAFKKIC